MEEWLQERLELGKDYQRDTSEQKEALPVAGEDISEEENPEDDILIKSPSAIDPV